MTQWHIEQEHYRTLLSYFGCGDFNKAKILVFGIEEGTGGHDIESNVEARTRDFGLFDVNGSLLSAINPPSREGGYWEPDGQTGGRKIREYIYQRDRILLDPKVTKGPFNEIIARISLDLEQPNDRDDYWFQLMNNDPEMAEQIRRRIQSLFQTSSEDLVHTALTDWKPLPRPDMKNWPDQYEPSLSQFGIDSRLYEKAFSLESNREFYDGNSNYSEDAQKRLGILRNVFRTFHIPIIISLGEIQTKKRVLQHIFPEAEFSSYESKVHPAHSGLKASFYLDNHIQTIWLLPFPDRRSAEWRKRMNKEEAAGVFMLRYFQEITQEYIKPILNITVR
jgi:hypothetical protein